MKGQRDRLTLHCWRLALLLFHSGSYRIKLLVAVLLLLTVTFLATRASSLLPWHHHQGEANCRVSRHRYTLVVNTWKREDLLKQVVNHYASCPNVDAIRVVWSEADLPSEMLRSTLLKSIQAKAKRVLHEPRLHFDINVEDDLNNRFKPIKGFHTDAIFSIDDDVIVPCKMLEYAFNVWQSAPDTMVGFVPRMHWVSSKMNNPTRPSYTYGGWWSVWWMGTYSMVLTKAAFFHRKYLCLYTHQLPPIILEYVKKERNCEDIAMSFLIANVTGSAPIWVKGNVHEIGSTGISSLTGHSHRRTDCLNYFASLFGYMPLVASNVKAVNARHEWFW